MPTPEDSLAPAGAAPASDVPQFATAEYAHIPGTERCKICNELVSGQYFRVNNQMACSRCGSQAQAGQPVDSHSAFARALLLGAGAALIGLTIYATFTIVTGWSIGYVALAVGWLVAKAMMKGSNGIGGTRYQVAAVLFTYFAISMASIPIIIAYGMKEKRGVGHFVTQQSSTDTTATASDEQNTAESAPAQHKQMDIGAALGKLALFGLASPFLALMHGGIIGIVILFVGLSIAFRFTAAKPLAVDGPYSVGA